MENLARKQNRGLAVQEYGWVLDCDDEGFLVETDSGQHRTIRAFSCVVEPENGDMVLVSLPNLCPGYILAVLERSAGAKATISFNADVDLKSTRGRVGVVAKDGLDLISESDVNLLAPKINATASEGEINCRRLSLLGELLEVKIDIVKLVADTFASFLKRFQRRTRYSFRQTEKLDQLSCGRLHYEAEKTLQLRGAFSQLTAKEDVHIDGERVNIG